MIHDPLCPISNACKSPCSMGRCAECSLEKENCQCDLIAKVREDMLAKCIAAVKEVRNELAHPDWVRLTARDGAQESVNELKRIQRALQEKP